MREDTRQNRGRRQAAARLMATPDQIGEQEKTSTLNVFTLNSGNDTRSDTGKAQALAS